MPQPGCEALRTLQTHSSLQQRAPDQRLEAPQEELPTAGIACPSCGGRQHFRQARGQSQDDKESQEEDEEKEKLKSEAWDNGLVH